MTTVRPFTCDDMFTFNNVYVIDYHFLFSNCSLYAHRPTECTVSAQSYKKTEGMTRAVSLKADCTTAQERRPSPAVHTSHLSNYDRTPIISSH